jgi:arginine exporter protein ArgO
MIIPSMKWCEKMISRKRINGTAIEDILLDGVGIRKAELQLTTVKCFCCGCALLSAFWFTMWGANAQVHSSRDVES